MADSEQHSNPEPRPDAQFPPTQWTLIIKAGGFTSTEAREALGQLSQTYWFPLYASIRRQGHDVHNAKDHTQAFFLHLSPERRLIAIARQAQNYARNPKLSGVRHGTAR